MRVSLTTSVIEEIVDTDCVMFLMNTKYLTLIFSKIIVLEMSALINVKDINNALHQSSFYVMLDLYLDELINESKTRDYVKRKFHLVDKLKCKLFMSLNIMTSEKMTINLADKSLIVLTCENLIILVRINSKSNSRIRRIVHSKEFVTIFSNFVTSISIYLRKKKLSVNRDFLFESNHDALTVFLDELEDFYTHVCDCNLAFVHVRNDLFKSMMISSRTRLELLTKYEKEKCFQIDNEYHE
jgi:hypothetical protein